jgi:hypothetical protein
MVASRVGGERPHAPKSPVATTASWDLEGTHLSAGGAPLSAAELETIRQWVAAGAQNN